MIRDDEQVDRDCLDGDARVSEDEKDDKNEVCFVCEREDFYKY